ncbi:hypothetical protein QL285_056955 [Trifolium repens]|nr:hypothetical protein QL285_056955 [Trifolium repens]
MEAKPNGYVSGLKDELVEMLKGVTLPEFSGIHEQYIYKVPERIHRANPQAYTPQIISIGPFHNSHGSSNSENILHQMEELKLKYLKGFLNRTKLCLDDFVLKLEEWENRIRSCYAGLISFNKRVLCPKHFTDLLRTFLLPSSFDFVKDEMGDAIEHVYSGVLKMPCFHVHDTTEIFMRNILAFEECHISDQDSSYISQYFSILNFLINTEKDVSILVEKKIIVNWMCDTNAVATMVNNLCKNLAMPILNSKYLSICYSIYCHVLLLLFTLIQAVCSVCTFL